MKILISGLEEEFKDKKYLDELLIFSNDNIISEINSFNKNQSNIQNQSDLDMISGEIDKFRAEHRFSRVTIFSSLGFNATGFKYFEKLDTTNLRKSFRDIYVYWTRI
ncbi:MAG: hypothetical protein U5N85_10830 [Arcicella sp.]|nr:hypothetical protein [Arcicella sp.]